MAASAALKAEMRRRGGAWAPLLELGLPGGKKRYGFGSYASKSAGLYEPRILEWSPYTWTTESRRPALALVESTVTIADHDGTLQRLIAGTRPEEITGSSAIARVVSPNLDPALWYTRFVGEVGDYSLTHSKRGPAWTFQLRPPDQPLRRFSGKKTISQHDWPNAHPTALGKVAPVIYGDCDSLELGVITVPPNDGYTIGTGMVPCFYLDTTAASGYRYSPGLGVYDVRRVFKDGVDQTTPGGGGFSYTVSYPEVGGHVWTVVKVTTDQGSAAITADVSGLAYNSDGTGGIIRNPADQIQHFFANFAYNEWRRGPYFPASAAAFDATRLAAVRAFLATRGFAGSGYIGDAALFGDLLDEWLQTWEIAAWWSSLGKIAMKAEDEQLPDPPYIDEPSWVGAGDQLDAVTLAFDSLDSLAGRATVEHIHSPAAGRFLRTTEVRDPAGPDLVEPLRMTWGRRAM